MLIGDWMTKEVLNVTPDTSMMKASKLMKDNNIRRLPVVDADGGLVGIVSDRDIRESKPSKATSLDMHELYYLLSEIKVRDIMTRAPLAVKATDTVEKAAVIMMRKRIGGLPVVNEENRLVGIITDSDVFRVMASITGATRSGIKIGLSLKPDAPLKPILDDLRAGGAKLASVLTACEPSDAEDKRVYIRIEDMDQEHSEALRTTLAGKYHLLHFVRDERSDLS